MKNTLRCLAIAFAVISSTNPLQAQSDVSFYAIFKMLSFEQDNPFVAVLEEESFGQDSSAISFGVFIATTGTNTVTSASVQPTGGSSVNVPRNDGGDNSFNLEQSFETKSELDAAFPNGDFTVVINAVNDGSQTNTLSLTGDTYPNAPRLSNFTAAQSINHAADFTLTWDAFVGGTATDVILVEIEQENGNGSNTILNSPSPGAPGQLTGLSTSFTIPSGTLVAGTEYEAVISFIKGVDSDMIYASGLAGYMKETSVQIRTAGAGPADSQPPNLNDVNPSFGSSDVADISAVTFLFSEPMDTGVNVADAISWTGVASPASFVYSWSADGRTLFCQYPPNHALNTQVTWTLNPSSSTTKIQDVAGNDLFEITGNFNTASTTSAGMPDVIGVFLIKAEFLSQSGSSPTGGSGFGVQAEAELRGHNTASSYQLSGPFGGPIAAEHSHGDSLELEAEYALKSDLDAFFPNGFYTNTLVTFNDGTKTIAVDIPTDTYPNDPTVQNFSLLSAVDSTIALNISWAAMTGGTTNDYIAIEICNDVGRTIYESPGPFENDASMARKPQFPSPPTLWPPGVNMSANSFSRRSLTSTPARIRAYPLWADLPRSLNSI